MSKTRNLTRKELYDLVWSEPMSVVCKQFGISDNGLRKHCKSMNIPIPPVGYWSKLKYGKPVEKPILPKDYEGKKQSVNLQEVDPNDIIVELIPPVDRYKEREAEIESGNLSYFVVPEVLYAKDPLIIDTKEKIREDRENIHLSKSPYKSKIKETLNVSVNRDSLDRTLSIFSTVIRSLRFRGHDILVKDNCTYAVVDGEKIQVSMTERNRKKGEAYLRELQFNIHYEYRWNSPKTFNDTTYTKVEDKIVSIIAFLEIRSDEIKEERSAAEKRRIEQEEKERLRKEFEAKRDTELKDFQSLFTMAERLYKANTIRNYVATYEKYLTENGIENEGILAKLEWAKEKADWLDPFISKDDEYLDCYKKDEIIQAKCPKEKSWRDTNYYEHSGNSYWAKPWWKKDR